MTDYTATFTRHGDDWMVRAVFDYEDDFVMGDVREIAVTKKDGTTETVTGRVVWTGENRYGPGYAALLAIKQKRLGRR